jgi:quercetin dioxygenase-like cupin family protein
MEYVRTIDFTAMDKSGVDVRWNQKLLDRTSDAKNCMVFCIKTPSGGGSPEGMHIHDFEQVFYLLRGTMSIEVEGKHYDCSPGSLIVFPAGVPHRNWNGGSEPTVHIAFNTPLPDPSAPFSKPVCPDR